MLWRTIALFSLPDPNVNPIHNILTDIFRIMFDKISGVPWPSKFDIEN